MKKRKTTEKEHELEHVIKEMTKKGRGETPEDMKLIHENNQELISLREKRMAGVLLAQKAR